MKLVRAFEEWEKVIRDQANFIRTTKGKHQIYYMPRRMLPANERALEDTEDYIEALVKERRKKLQEEIDRIMSAPFRNRQRSNNDRGNAEQMETPADKSDHSGSDSEDSNDEIEEGEVSVAEPSEQQDVPMEMQAIKVKREETVVVKHEVLEEGKGDEGSEGDNQSQQVSHGLGDEIPVSDDELDESSTSQQLTQQSLASAPSQQESSGKSKVHSNTQEEGKSGGRGRNANSASKSRSRSPQT
ncbi:hypothetical protein EB796_014195 [Bugula neritina]|uniref:Uncharacterized protein n=1 Tax=Bugula neritina TaxID=10212 RepID=A0A7J7JND5_BUGNE|nr:hypothetical protein EB796_014195 [Bugula neritina]